jgi:hypothetical protein
MAAGRIVGFVVEPRGARGFQQWFWQRMERQLGSGYARVWADTQVMRALGGRTAREALEAGETPKQVWFAVHQTLELPPSER